MSVETIDSLLNLSLRLRSLSVFRDLLKDPVLVRLLDFLAQPSNDVQAQVGAYAAFVAALFDANAQSLAEYVRDLVCDNENAYVRTVGQGNTPTAALERNTALDIETLQLVCDLTPEQLTRSIEWAGDLPVFPAGKVDLADSYGDWLAHISTRGFGVFARFHAFYLRDNGSLEPVRYPDPTRLSDLIGYQRQRQQVIDNTLALLAGKPAANVLLTGDAGTGKSATVKAVANEFAPRGLRIIEVRKDQLHCIPELLDRLASNPLKFILFIDDLSFVSDDDNFSALKATLEGSISARSRNVAIYATSNRRHLLKESFSAREGDDVHLNDTLQETVSLSERFGLRIGFDRPDRDTYLEIVHDLARRAGLEMDTAELDLKAERFALGRAGRSARGARQFVDSLLASAVDEENSER